MIGIERGRELISDIKDKLRIETAKDIEAKVNLANNLTYPLQQIARRIPKGWPVYLREEKVVPSFEKREIYTLDKVNPFKTVMVSIGEKKIEQIELVSLGDRVMAVVWPYGESHYRIEGVLDEDDERFFIRKMQSFRNGIYKNSKIGFRPLEFLKQKIVAADREIEEEIKLQEKFFNERGKNPIIQEGNFQYSSWGAYQVWSGR